MIARYVKERGITEVFHFTRVENLGSILKNGLLPRDQLKKKGIKFKYNDTLRLDDYPHASCLSISWPNYKMFYACRCTDQKAKWVVVSFKPDILWAMRCAFCKENAASKREKYVSAEEKLGAECLMSLFEEGNGVRSRTKTRIPAHYPTNPQAEVLAFGEISSSYIQEIYFNDKQLWAAVIQKIPHIKCTYEARYFEPRSDWKYWKW